MNSALPRISQPVSSEALRSLISGVLPMASITERCMEIPQAGWIGLKLEMSGPPFKDLFFSIIQITGT
jgi:hypothetical protein